MQHLAALSFKIQTIWPWLGLTGDAYVLVGGTALAYRLGHRESVDIDLATSLAPGHPNTLRKRWGDPVVGKHKWVRRKPDHYIKFFETATTPKIDIHGKVPGGCLEAPETADNGLRIASVTDILYRKLVAMTVREKERDGEDVAAILDSGLADVPNAVAALRDDRLMLGVGLNDALNLAEDLRHLERTAWAGFESLRELARMLSAKDWPPPKVAFPKVEGPHRVRSLAQAEDAGRARNPDPDEGRSPHR